MIFDAYAALSKISSLAPNPAKLANPAKPAPKPLRTLARLAALAAPPVQKPEKPNADVFQGTQHTPPPGEVCSPYGCTVGGRCLTWTGKVVDLEELRKLTDWERHGSTGRMWNGTTRKWELKSSTKRPQRIKRRSAPSPAEPPTIQT